MREHKRPVRDVSTQGAKAQLPFVVVEGPASAIDADLSAARAAGFDVVPGLRPTQRARGSTVVTGVVATPTDAADAVLAALAGAGLIVTTSADRPTVDRLIDDLRHLGRVDHRIVSDSPVAGVASLQPEARAILGLLADGLSLGEAADALGLARRTADRRLAEARRALGVERTTEAIARARRLGWLSRGMGDRA